MMGLPAEEYALVEFNCSDAKCDCRKVILQVWNSQNPGVSIATFNFGWESPDFYVRWMHGDESAGILSGLSLEPISPQSRHAEPLMAPVEMGCRKIRPTSSGLNGITKWLRPPNTRVARACPADASVVRLRGLKLLQARTTPNTLGPTRDPQMKG